VALSPSKRAQTKGKDIPLTTASMFTPEGHVSAVVFFFFFLWWSLSHHPPSLNLTTNSRMLAWW
jgi:hypothetical protein